MSDPAFELNFFVRVSREIAVTLDPDTLDIQLQVNTTTGQANLRVPDVMSLQAALSAAATLRQRVVGARLRPPADPTP